MTSKIIGNPVLIVFNMQRSGGLPLEQSGIPTMAGFEGRVERIGRVVRVAREAGMPIVFFAARHRVSHADFGRELDGDEGVHCVEGAPDAEFVESLRPKGEREHLIVNRR
ncbi:MAG: cysteine hydrolase [Alphaproteobacteria bacterium]|nr:cysteine hydrolase [Alphaproteobacteria bacterium]